MKYFVSFAFVHDGKQGFGWSVVESDIPLVTEMQLVDLTKVLMQERNQDNVTILNFFVLQDTRMAGTTLSGSKEQYGSN